MTRQDTGRRPRRRKGKKQQALLVNVQDFRDFDTAVKYFVKLTSGVVREAKRRQHFFPKQTRAARKRRGILLAKREARLGTVLSEEEERRSR